MELEQNQSIEHINGLKEFEDLMKQVGVEFIKKNDVKEGKGIAVGIQLNRAGVDYSKLIGLDIAMKKKTKRKDIMYVVLHKQLEHNLEFIVGMPSSDKEFQFFKKGCESLTKMIGTTFPDLCWYHAEGTTEGTLNEVDTDFDYDIADVGDLSRYLPSRFVDNLIEIMHDLNHTILCGTMQDAIIYGPVAVD